VKGRRDKDKERERESTQRYKIGKNGRGKKDRLRPTENFRKRDEKIERERQRGYGKRESGLMHIPYSI
jgi:hypothetical protein